MGGTLYLGPPFGLPRRIFYLGTGVGFWLLRHDLFGSAPNGPLLRDLLRFSKWTALANLSFLLQPHLGVFAITSFSGAQMAGIYAAAACLLLAVEHLSVTILTVQLPSVSKLTELAAYRAYARRSVLLCIGVALTLSPAIFLASPLILFLYGPAYQGAIPVFRILFIGLLATLITHPLYLVFYTMGRPYLYTLTSVTALAGWLATGIWLIPSMGAVGAAWATLSARLIDAALIAYFMWYTLSRQPRRKAQGLSPTEIGKL